MDPGIFLFKLIINKIVKMTLTYEEFQTLPYITKVRQSTSAWNTDLVLFFEDGAKVKNLRLSLSIIC